MNAILHNESDLVFQCKWLIMKQISFSIHIFTLFQYFRYTVLALNKNIMNMTFFFTRQ
jgi:hypothetical protein